MVRPTTAACSAYTTHAAIRPDRRLQTNRPGGSGTPSDGRRRKTPLRTPDIAKRVEPSEGRADLQAGCVIVPPLCGLSVAKAQKRLSSPEQHEADGCASPASSTGPIRAKRHGAAAGLAVSSPKPAAKKWALRPPSRAQRRQRRPYGRAMPPMGDASRSELSNPALGGPNAKRAPGRGVRPTQQGVQAFAAGRRSRRAAPADGALTSQLRSKVRPLGDPHDAGRLTARALKSNPKHHACLS